MKTLRIWVEKLLKLVCPPELFEQIEGDIIELHALESKNFSPRMTELRRTWRAIRFFRPAIVLRRQRTSGYSGAGLLSSYFVMVVRGIRRQPLFAAINVASLSIALSAALLIFLFVHQQLTFDNFHTHKDHIYRLLYQQTSEHGMSQVVSLNGTPFGPDMQREFPEILTYTRYWDDGSSVYTLGENTQLIKQVALVDSTFFDVFDFELLMGDKSTALDEPNSILLTESTALKFFTSTSAAFGQTIRERASNPANEHVYTITGILKDPPINSHLQFSLLESISTYARADRNFNDWSSNFLNTYFVLRPATTPQQIEAKIPEWLIRWTGVPDVNKSHAFTLQPLSQIHLDSSQVQHDYSNVRKFNRVYVHLFSIVGIMILLIGVSNFVNITLARATFRLKEIGVRKSLGAFRRQLIRQFVFETTLVVVCSMLLALLVDVLLIPIINDQLDLTLTLDPLTNSTILLAITGSILALGILTSLYPAAVLASSKVVTIFRGVMHNAKTARMQPTLIVIQFSLSLMLIIGTLTVKEQLALMRDRDPGFQREQMLLVEMNREANAKFSAIKEELSTHSIVLGVTAASQRLGNNIHQTTFAFETEGGTKKTYTSGINVDKDFFKVYGIAMAAGRDFRADVPTDDHALVINEAMARDLALKSPVGVRAGVGDELTGSVIGVTKDFNFNSLHYKVAPMAMISSKDWSFGEMTVKLDAHHMAEGIALVEKVWKKHITFYPFTYTFLNDHFEWVYQTDRQLASIMTITTWLAIVLACMGLFGLASIMTVKRTKEVGIRKVLGASFLQIIYLLSSKLAKLIAVSFLAAVPVIYYVMNRWLEGFAFRVEVGVMPFAVGGLLILTAAMLAISLHTVRAARVNPAECLRLE